jgi:hypothetical protein
VRCKWWLPCEIRGLEKCRVNAWQQTKFAELTKHTKSTNPAKSADTVQKTCFLINRAAIS